MHYMKNIAKRLAKKNYTPAQKEEWYSKLSIVRRNKLEVLYHLQNGKCCYCNRDTVLKERGCAKHNKNHASLEHVVDQSKGGTDHMSNLKMACVSCNSSNRKGEKPSLRDIENRRFKKQFRRFFIDLRHAMCLYVIEFERLQYWQIQLFCDVQGFDILQFMEKLNESK